MTATKTATLDILSTTPYANQYGYSDVSPFEIVRQVSERTLEVRALRTERAVWTPKVYIGGFAAHIGRGARRDRPKVNRLISNQHEQRWNVTVNPDAPVVRIRLGKRGWKDSNGNAFRLNASPVKFYDFNF